MALKQVQLLATSLEDDQPEFLRRYQALLPALTRAALDIEGTCMTFAFPIDEQIPGWVALLRFVMGPQDAELAGFEVAYFGKQRSVREDDLERDLMALAGEFHDWVGVQARRSLTGHVPPGGLTMRHLRGIRVGAFQTAARRYLSSSGDSYRLPEGWKAAALRRPGKAGKADLHYAQLAQAYVQLDRHPVATLAATENLSHASIRNQLMEARKRGLLTTAGPGRAGGQLTAKALRLLERSES